MVKCLNGESYLLTASFDDCRIWISLLLPCPGPRSDFLAQDQKQTCLGALCSQMRYDSFENSGKFPTIQRPDACGFGVPTRFDSFAEFAPTETFTFVSNRVVCRCNRDLWNPRSEFVASRAEDHKRSFSVHDAGKPRKIS
ncbi:hypothetical protein LCGC14_1255820 [marine sediment metagenome]|uniref:Uncharacterized protein n=1 Tax=marine sediment metagenome TaxID=412755 RepID=A0A0F9LNC9_9ZZZZ